MKAEGEGEGEGRRRAEGEAEREGRFEARLFWIGLNDVYI